MPEELDPLPCIDDPLPDEPEESVEPDEPDESVPLRCMVLLDDEVPPEPGALVAPEAPDGLG